MSYRETFIEVAPDSGATAGVEPPTRGAKRSVASIEFELISAAPHVMTQEDVQYAVHVVRAEDDGVEPVSRDQFFSKPHACMRASALGKRYGWGIHFDAEGRMALVACDDPSYRELASDPSLTHLAAMRSSRVRD